MSQNDSDQADKNSGGWINEHFTLIVSEGKKMRHCKAENCGAIYAGSSSHNSFRGHWRQKHFMEVPRKTVFMFHDQLHTSRLVKLIVEEQLEYRLVDRSAFRNFCESLDKNKEIISRSTLSSVILSKKDVLQKLVKTKLKDVPSIALTFDLWSQYKGGRGFGCLTGHFVDNAGNLNATVLEFKRMDHPHDAVTISTFIRQTIEDFDLSNKIISITTDNASNMEAAVVNMRNCLDLGTSRPFGFTHYRCIAHIIHLGVTAALKEMKPLMKDVKELVLAIKSSGKRAEIFRNIQTMLIEKGELDGLNSPLELLEDVKHRWNSAYIMLARAYKLRVAICRFLSESNDLHGIGDMDWTGLEKIIVFLKPFYELTCCLSSENSCTISFTCVVVPKLLEHVSKVRHGDILYDAVASLKSKLLSYIDKMYQPTVLIATVLDPRFKAKSLSTEMIDQVTSQLNRMLESEESTSVLRDQSRESSGSTSILDEIFEQDEDDEIERYLRTPCCHRSTDVYKFWGVNSENFPKLSSIALKILPIQATSVASEGIFSISGDLGTPKRNKLSDSSFESNILIKSWMKYANCE